MLAFTQLVCPTLRCAWAPSWRSAKRARPGEDRVYDNMVGQDHAVEPATATTATVPWLLTYLLHTGCTKIGHSGCPVHHRRCQNRAFHVLEALVKLAGLGDAIDTMPLRTSWGEGCLSVDGIFHADAGWWAKMDDIQQKGCPLLTDPGSRLAGPSPTDWTSLASILWHCTRLRWLTRGARKNKWLHDTALDVTTVALASVTRGLIMWMSRQSEPSTGELLACHPAGKKIHPALIARLEQKRDKRCAIRQWAEDGLRARPNVCNLETKTSSRYVHQTRKIFAEERIVELVMDSTMLATRDTQISIAFACHSGVAAYLPPITHRHLRWHQEAPGDIVDEEDFKRFEQQGLRTLAHLDGQDCIRSINHVLRTGLRKDLSTFKPQEALSSMPIGGVRYWDLTLHRWVRAPATGSGPPTYELPDSMLAGISALLLTVDQKQSQWAAAQYMADSIVGLGLFTAPRPDPYHRSWRDFQFAMTHSQGNFRHTSVQLNMALNVNYQPFGSGSHLSKRQDVKQEWARLLPTYDEQFETLAGKIAMDLRETAPRSLVWWRFDIVAALQGSPDRAETCLDRSGSSYCFFSLKSAKMVPPRHIS